MSPKCCVQTSLIRAIAIVLGILAPAVQSSAAEMVFIPAGLSRIGSANGNADEQPVFNAAVPAFYLDKSPVTVADFANFVAQQDYLTTAEQLGSAAVMEFGTGHWYLMPGANWRHPAGPHSPAAADDHPVTQVSWQDAVAYCDAQNKRLPTEVEWEHAARAGHEGEVAYAFGNELLREGDYLANIWTGAFPVLNTADDGHKTTAPVGLYGLTPIGLTDMAGNVWEWTADWYASYTGRQTPDDAPLQGNSKVQRGGSFLCDPAVCHGFRVSARGHATPDSALMHVGFRCARSAEDATWEPAS